MLLTDLALRELLESLNCDFVIHGDVITSLSYVMKTETVRRYLEREASDYDAWLEKQREKYGVDTGLAAAMDIINECDTINIENGAAELDSGLRAQGFYGVGWSYAMTVALTGDGYVEYCRELEDEAHAINESETTRQRYEVRRNWNNESAGLYRVVEVTGGNGRERLAHDASKGYDSYHDAEEFAESYNSYLGRNGRLL